MSGSSDKKSAKAGAVHHPAGAADLRSRVPAMTDDALNTLQTNARRLLDTGSNAQRIAATELIPVIESELAERKAKKIASQPARKASAGAKLRKPKKPKEKEEEAP
jgi:hypothetical protein